LVTPQLALQEIRRRVPHPEVGVAPPEGISLVNIQTLLWADTPPDVTLGSVTLLGKRVGLRVHVEQVAWDFGDGSTDVTDSPGKRYDNDHDPCRTVLCPDYYGHVYRRAGVMQVSAQITWSGQFQIGDGAWQPIAGTVTGSAQTTTVSIRQARGVLVDPGQH
jgi:hypothetical protein